MRKIIAYPFIFFGGILAVIGFTIKYGVDKTQKLLEDVEYVVSNRR